MASKHLITCCAMLIGLWPCATYAGDSGTRTRPRYSPPQLDETRGWVDLPQYFAMEDPKQAGRLLLEEATVAGLNLDDSSRVCKDTGITLPGRRLEPSTQRREQTRAVRSGRLTEATDDQHLSPFLVKFWRHPTIRETSQALSLGVRFSRPFGEGAYVLLMRSQEAKEVAALPCVSWIEPYIAEYKIPPGLSLRNEPHNAWIETAIGDQQVCRDDLQRLGIAIREGLPPSGLVPFENYEVTMSQDDVAVVATLWWVLRIEAAPVIEH